uniref:Uncharacterized protein n=1 Tax=Anguilla anguilla TaxID=7936 RepID=A0A0E9TK12_ANGAN
MTGRSSEEPLFLGDFSCDIQGVSLPWTWRHTI